MSNLIIGIKMVAVAWVAMAIAYTIGKNFLFPYYKHYLPTQEEIFWERLVKLDDDHRPRVPWFSTLCILAAGGLVAGVFREIGWDAGMWAVFAGYLIGAILAQILVEIERRSPELVESSTPHIFDSIIAFFQRLSIPLGFILLLMIQEDPRFAAEKWWPVGWRSLPGDSLSGCAVPVGVLALSVGFHVFSLLHRSLNWRKASRKDLHLSMRLIINGTWIWLALVAALVAACLMVRGLGEIRVGWAIAGGLLAAFFVAVPLWPRTFSDNARGLGRWLERRAIFDLAFGGVLRLAVVPAACWAAWVMWQMAPNMTPAHEVLRSVVRGFLVAVIVPVSALLFYSWTRSKLQLVLRPWPIAAAILSAAILTAPLAVGLNNPAYVGLLAILAGMLLGFLCTGAPEGDLRFFLKTAFVVWLLAATAAASLSPLIDGTHRPVLWPMCLLAVTGVGLVYGSWLRRRVSYLESV
jgi:hypothetical protein